MDKKTKEALDLIEKIKEPNDFVYGIIRKEKKSRLYHLFDFMLDLIPSTVDPIINDKTMLIASEKNGTIVEISHGKIVSNLDVPNWINNRKDNFKKVVIQNYIYKKYR